MKMIVAVDQNWAIGNKGALLERIPEDLERFKKLTSGKVVIMGRKTLESLPKSKPLPNRTNVVVTRDMEFKRDDAIVCHGIAEVVQYTSEFNPDDVWVIGGAEIYSSLLPFCTEAYVTMIFKEHEADAFAPKLNDDPDWGIHEIDNSHHHDDVEYRFITYRRLNLKEDVDIERSERPLEMEWVPPSPYISESQARAIFGGPTPYPTCEPRVRLIQPKTRIESARDTFLDIMRYDTTGDITDIVSYERNVDKDETK